jgi:hypothetical protein
MVGGGGRGGGTDCVDCTVGAKIIYNTYHVENSVASSDVR